MYLQLIFVAFKVNGQYIIQSLLELPVTVRHELDRG